MIYDTYKGIFINIVLDEMKKQRGAWDFVGGLVWNLRLVFER